MCKTAWTTSLLSNDIRRRGKPSSKRDYNISNAERAWYKTREECVLGCLDMMPCLWEPRKGR